jgi:hypothetical protein
MDRWSTIGWPSTMIAGCGSRAVPDFVIERTRPTAAMSMFSKFDSAGRSAELGLPAVTSTPIMNAIESLCPGCGLRMPRCPDAVYDGYFNTTPECWDVFTEVVGKEFGNAMLFGQVHQLTVDAYAAQHAGGNHRDKSVVVHLCGLYLVLDRGLRPTMVPRVFQRLAAMVRVWPHFSRPDAISEFTVFDVALADSIEDHTRLVREWAKFVWQSWSPYHQELKNFLSEHLDLNNHFGTVVL